MILSKKANDSTTTEGAVVYRITNGEVVWIYKVKSYSYSAKRSQREILKKNRGIPTVTLAKKLKQKWQIFAEGQIPEELLKELLQFSAWMQITYLEDDATAWAVHFTQYTDVWQAFNKLTAEERQEFLEKYNLMAPQLIALEIPVEMVAPKNTQLQLLAVGLSGSGKSTIGEILMKELVGFYFDQDECCEEKRYNAMVEKMNTSLAGKSDAGKKVIAKLKGSYQKSNSGKKLYNTMVQKMTLDNPLPIFAGKIHHNADLRQNVCDNITELGHLAWVVFMHPDDMDGSYDNLIETCIARATSRVGHATLTPEMAPEVIRRQADEFSIPTDVNVILVDVTRPKEEIQKHLHSEVERIQTYYAQGGKVPMPIKQVFPVYTSLVLDAESASVIRNHPTVVSQMGNFSKIKDLHVTLLHQGGKPHIDSDKVSALENKVFEFEATHLAFDNDAIAVVVTRGNYWSFNEITHITLGAANGKRPAWSKTMLKSSVHKAFDAPIKLKGTVTVVYAKQAMAPVPKGSPIPL
jgi:gluconate kinase